MAVWQCRSERPGRSPHQQLARRRGLRVLSGGRCHSRPERACRGAWTVLGARRGPQCSEDQCGMVLCVVCSESQRAVRACRPERHRRPRRRRCTRFEARRRPGGPQAAEQRRKDASKTVQRSACRGRRFRVKRERTLTASHKGADESLFLWVPKRRLDEARFSSIRCDGTVPIFSDSAQQSIARIGGGKKTGCLL